MAEQTKPKKLKKQPTPRQAEIARLVEKGRDRRTDQESARLDQLRKEEARDRFLRLAPARTNKTLKALDSLCNCASAASYDYKPEEAARIVAALENAVEEVRTAFSRSDKEDVAFTL